MRISHYIIILTLIFLGLAGTFVLVMRISAPSAPSPAMAPIVAAPDDPLSEREENERILADRAALRAAMASAEHANPVASTTPSERLQTLREDMKRAEEFDPTDK